MPLLDEWGLRLEGLEGPRENPIFVAPVLVDPVARAPNEDAAGRAPPGTPGATPGERVLSGAPEMAGPEAPSKALEAAPGELVRPGAPKAKAGELVWPDAPEARAGELVRPNAHEATAPEAQASAPEVGACCPVAKGHAPTPGSLCLGLAALYKRKGLPSCSGDAYRPLKQRKYIAIDE